MAACRGHQSGTLVDMGFSAAQAEAALNHFPNRGVSVTGVSVLEKFGKISQYVSRLSRMEDVQKGRGCEVDGFQWWC